MILLNGRLDVALLTELPSAPGAYLQPWAATSWEALCADVEATYGWRPRLTSTADAYRPYAVQERIFRQRYTPDRVTGIDPRQWLGRVWWRLAGFAAAAVPGTSNHGLGITCDVRDAAGALRYRTEHFNEFATKATAHGWSNVEGRSVNEAWHWTKVTTTTVSNPIGGATGSLPKVDPGTLPDDLTENDMTPDQAAQLQAVHDALFPEGGTPLYALADHLPSRVVNAQIARDGGPFTLIQEVADAKTLGLRANAKLDGILSALQRLADVQPDVDLTEITAAVRDAVAALPLASIPEDTADEIDRRTRERYAG